MTGPNLLALLVAAATAAPLAVYVSRRPHPQFVRENHAGRLVPAVLGQALVVGALLGRQVGFLAGGDDVRWQAWDVVTLSGVFALLVVGVLDDRRTEGPRGLGGHVASLLRGRPTTGILKLAVGVGAAAAVAALAGDGATRIVFGALLIAASVNVTNALDVVPGRALKWVLVVVAAVLAPLWDGTYALLGAATLGAALAVLPLDLGEGGMLGDGGSNPLGWLDRLGRR